MERNLFEASLTGNVQVLNALLQEDNLILDRLSLTCFNETPLHIASSKGNLDFVRILLSTKPMLAISLDSLRRTPLHLASAEGHVEVVREILHTMGSVDVGCGFLRDQDGRTPLHAAVVNGRLEVIEVLIRMKPEMGREIEENGETILHSCITFSCFEGLKLLLELWSDEEVAKMRDGNGNTLLHLAVVHKQIQTVKFLIQNSRIREAGNVINEHGFTALDVLDHRPRDFRTLEIQSLLMEANITRAKPFRTSTESKSTQNTTDLNRKPKGCMSRIWNWYLNENGNWLEKQRGILAPAAVIVATTSFYSGLHPPGGTFTDSENGSLGNAVQAEREMDDFSTFLTANTTIMVLSLMVTVMFLSGIPLGNKLCLWVLNLSALCIMVFMIFTYLQQIASMSPDGWVNGITTYMCFAWILLCFLFAFIHTILLIIWVIKKLSKGRTTTKKTKDPSVGPMIELD
ncbi:hypothetical protein OSB04_019185 [Centaurea solstitialis]|uniref:PGG domain-containing protein n=1 Tax=Centaurea solstitialis TaxID=347529 RepID=A0AA38T8A4_9ASTR|nr:hypothetical protein OSB04_019185 [Centaurea solstitialis]